MALADNTTVSLENLKGGAVVQLFDALFEIVKQNIMDPNTSAVSTREVTVKLQIKPDVNRATAKMNIVPSLKMAPPEALSTMIFLGKKGGQVLAWEHDPDQLDMGFGREDVTVVNGGKAAGE